MTHEKFRLKEMGGYEDVFPLHDGEIGENVFQFSFDEFDPDESDLSTRPSMRQVLRRSWARFGRTMFCIQPLDQVMQYFGATTAIYFAWLGFYTQMLIPPAIVGFVVFLRGSLGFGWFNLIDDAPTAKELCEDERVLCPRCDGPAHQCKFDIVNESCTYAKLTALFDNGWGVFFALFMAVWAHIFCTLWKRKQMHLKDKWNLEDETGDGLRLEYENRIKEMRTNPNFIDKFLENFYPLPEAGTESRKDFSVHYIRRLPYLGLSVSVMVTLGCIALSSVVLVTIYRTRSTKCRHYRLFT